MSHSAAAEELEEGQLGNPEAAAACGFSYHQWTQLQNGSYRPTAHQWIRLARWLSIDVPEVLLDEWQAERAVA